ncbi:MAG: DUF4398 domain-containing protein [Desulfobacteraceae bacterium]|jgi:hypothetical protein|nr:DUF4398 domain-containing protein [Desulfobacteraceae bacterium]
MPKKKTIRKIVGISVLSLSLLSGACASGTPPVAKIANVENAITRARESTAMTYAPLDLKLAEKKLMKSKALVEKKEYSSANQLLDEALIDAKLAEAKSRSEQEKNQAAEMKDSIESMRKEIEYKSQTH